MVEYPSPQLFLDDCEPFLAKREIANNLILGICNGFADKTRAQEGCVFISAGSGKDVKAASIKTAAKAIIAAEPNTKPYVKISRVLPRKQH